ncbi:hypothetical protein [Haloarcula sp. JP-L23]|uniref:hypothetical protein n=1 Tax=Haloarcula sp. JP-L23 TaxID=2716717 RepID=UPI00140E9D36|nr:hypothetical protein G9465_20435 [Haloarcula sp. JP-L23]
MFELDIATRGVPINFFIESPTSRIAISQQLLADGGQRTTDTDHLSLLDRVGQNTVGQNRVVTIPKKFFPDYEGKATGSQPLPETVQLHRGQHCHFVLTETLYQHSACYIVDDKREIVEIMRHGASDILTDGGRPNKDLIDQSELDDDEVLWVERNKVISVERAQELLSGGERVSESVTANATEASESEETVPETESSLDSLPGSVLPMGDIDISNPQLTDVDARVLDTNIVWRHGDSGDEAHFRVIVAVGNFDGYLGTGQGREKHVGEAVKAAIDSAKTNVSRVSRDCAPMQCVCGEPHTVPRATEGRAGSLSVEIRPAQEGLGVAASSVVEDILELAGIEDAFVTADDVHGRTEPLIRATVRALWGVDSGSRTDPSGERQFDPEDIC